MAEKLTDEEIVAICEAEIDAASGFSSSELSEVRADAMDYYLGEPYGDEVEGRSQFRTREVFETIQNLMPSLMRVFAEAENLVTFDPVGPEDIEQAKQESDRVNYCFWKQNRGFYNVYSFCQDALLSKTGTLKAYWEPGKVEREEHRSVNEFEIVQLMSEPAMEREIVEVEQNEDGTYSVVMEATPIGQVRIEPAPPEEVGVNRDARSPYAQDAKFVYHRSRKSMSDLVQEGFDRKILETIPTNDDVETEERLARRNLDDESDVLRFGSHPSMRTFWITECYAYLDRDGDGISELLKVTLAAGAGSVSSGARLLDIEEVDGIPLFTAPPSILTHKFYGLSIADMVMDIQRITSTLLRQMLDNTYLANNQRVHVNDNVNLDDMLTRRPGGVVRHKDTTDPKANISPEPMMQLPSDTYGLLEYLEKVIKERTGAAEDVAGLDIGALANLNTGVAAMALDRIRMKVELIAQTLAEIGFRPLFQHVHGLLQKHQDKAEVVQLRGKWVEVNPSEWRSRKNLTVNIGVGVASRERRLMALQDVWDKQQLVVQGGGMGRLLTEQHIYNLMSDYVEAWGFDSEKYWMDPATVPPQPEQPDPQLVLAQMMAQVEMEKAQAQRERNQIEMAKAQRDGQISVLELQQKQRASDLEKQIEQIKLDRERLKDERADAQGMAKLTYDAEIRSRDQEIALLTAKLADRRAQAGQEVEIYKARLAKEQDAAAPDVSGLDIGRTYSESELDDMERETIERGQREAEKEMAEQERERQHAAEMQAMQVEMDALRGTLGQIAAAQQQAAEERTRPLHVERDESGRAVRVGGRDVRRNAQGLVEGIG